MIKNIIFDFDGVILDSIHVKTEAFKKLFQDYPKKYIDELIDYHKKNGGVSRYEKIRYFFIEILKKKEISDELIKVLAHKYSLITRNILSDPKLLIKDTIEFIENNYHKYNFHIASGADEKDLKYICGQLGIDKYFLSINGSPKIKKVIVKDILMRNCYKEEETILIGDSINDYEAAKANNIKFYGYNNKDLKEQQNYITTFQQALF